MAPGTLSDLMGYTSIACWLFAQFPQVLENARRQSCDGLALPFLLNWLLGDITNLIGCVLTHQLPFQTVLAAYFVSVDFTLFSQYFYYKLREPKASSPKVLEPTTPTSRYGHGHVRSSTDHERFRVLSTAAANVALAAAIAADEEELHVHETHGKMGTSMTRSEAAEAEDEVDDSALAALADSFHSDSGRKHVSWSQERYGSGRGGSTSRTRTLPPLSPLVTVRPSFASPTTDTSGEHSSHLPGRHAEFDARGRPRQRQVVDSPMGDEDLEAQQEGTLSRTVSRETILERRNSRASSKAVGLVFLGAWALFNIGSLSSSKGTLPTNLAHRTTTSEGVVLSQPYIPDSRSIDTDPRSHPFSEVTSYVVTFPDHSGHFRRTSETHPPSSERILGRISAWTCTTLYLTSRLPQIWKNFVRRSVEGLSVYLFVFAFLGNTFYVISILTSPNMSLPQPESHAFLMECIPYLLGSGGTLLFDVTIVIQYMIYNPNPKFRHRRTRTLSTTRSRSRAGSYPAVPSSHTGTVGKHTRSLSRRGRSLSGARITSAFPRSRSTSLLDSEQAPLLSSEAHDIERGYEHGHGYSQSRRRKETSETDGGGERVE